MALIKDITLESGITVNYHRIVSVNNITNYASVIEIASYTSSAKREEEKTALKNNEPMNVFIHTQYLKIAYDKSLDVDEAYAYLKTLPEFVACADDL